MLSQSFANYRQYIGATFEFHFERNEDPTQGGRLYYSNLQQNISRMTIIGTRRLLAGFDEKSESELEKLQG